MNNREGAARTWLSQAENDLTAARLLLRNGFFAQACFLSHQVTEKALKAVAYYDGDDEVTGHRLRELTTGLQTAHPKLSDCFGIAGLLDRYYIPTRYPSAPNGTAPFEAYTKEQATEAIEGAGQVVSIAKDQTTVRERWWTRPRAMFRKLLGSVVRVR